eukprot:UN17227
MYDRKSFNLVELDKCRAYFIRQCNVSRFNFPPNVDKNHNCPVCLEKIVNKGIRGSHSIIFVLCNHYFHVDCLAKWQDRKGCPVCRYVTSPEVTTQT